MCPSRVRAKSLEHPSRRELDKLRSAHRRLVPIATDRRASPSERAPPPAAHVQSSRADEARGHDTLQEADVQAVRAGLRESAKGRLVKRGVRPKLESGSRMPPRRVYGAPLPRPRFTVRRGGGAVQSANDVAREDGDKCATAVRGS